MPATEIHHHMGYKDCDIPVREGDCQLQRYTQHEPYLKMECDYLCEIA